jgi:serine/threonine protein kinase
MSFGELHWEEKETLFGITMLKMESDLAKELEEARKDKKFPYVREILEQIVKGMIEMHRKGFTHLDLKPGNILVIFEISDIVY